MTTPIKTSTTAIATTPGRSGRRVVRLLAVALFATGCGEETVPEAPPPLTEVKTDAVTEQAIEGAPAGHKLRATRGVGGHRHLEHYDGTTWATFLAGDDPLIPLNMDAVHRDGQTLVCAQAILEVDELSGLRVVCAVRADGAAAFAQRGTLEGEPNAWLNDVCVGEAGRAFTLLVSSARTPYPDLANLADLERAPCGALAWDGAAWVGTDQSACACAQLDGKPCDDPCFLGAGQWQGGRCDTTGLAPRCDDGNPATADYCTGDPDNLCAHEEGAELLPP